MAVDVAVGRVPPEDLYDALANERRRAVIQDLDRDADWVDVQALAERVATRTADGNAVAQESVYISLIQVHLPKLDRYGIVAYDEERKLVRPDGGFAQTTACLSDHLRESESDTDVHQVVAIASVLALLVALAVPLVRLPVMGTVAAVHLAVLAGPWVSAASITGRLRGRLGRS